MSSSQPQRTDYDALIRAWEDRAPWFRRFLARIGLQGKLILCFSCLLALTVASSLVLYISESRKAMARVLADQVGEVAQLLAITCQKSLDAHDVPALNAIAEDLICNVGIVGIAFHDIHGRSLASASRDRDSAARPAYLDGTSVIARGLPQPQYTETLVFGEVAHVTVPVFRLEHEKDTSVPAIAGYATVAMIQVHQQRLLQVQMIHCAVGLIAAMLCVPLVSLLVHRIFLPIRQLVTASERIAGGDLSSHVEVNRPDLIGVLARSFNQMQARVKQQQDRLAEANRDLEAKVKERTAQLEAANKRLSSEIAEKEAFLRAVSHDLNAPLRNIAGMTAMLLVKNREKFDADTLDRLERISRNVKTEADLIAELLELSRIKTRRLKAEPVELSAMINELRELFEDDLRSRRIDLIVDNPMPIIHGERARLRQVFLNLIDNAVKYMGDGDLREIHIGCTVHSDECRFYVRDTGVGIDPADVEKVFYVFRRGRSPTVQAVPGKGVGLASVKSIVETYSGSIWVKSAIGKGSTFHFTINGRFLTAGALVPSPGDSLSGGK